MKKKLYLIFGFLSSLNTKQEIQNQKQENLNFTTSNIIISDEEIFLNLLKKFYESDNENKTFIHLEKFIQEKKHSIEKLIKFGLAFALSVSQIKLQKIPDQIILKLDSLTAFLTMSFIQDIITESSILSVQNIKEILKKNQELLKDPEKHKAILVKLFQGDLTQLKFILSSEQYEKYANSYTFKKFISDIKPYSSIFIEFIIFYSQQNQFQLTNQEIDSINRLLNQKFKNKFYEKFLKLNESLELLKNEVLKENFKNVENFFNLLQIELNKNINAKFKKIEQKGDKNIQTLSEKDKKEIATLLDLIYIIVEELQPNNMKKLIKKIKKA